MTRCFADTAENTNQLINQYVTFLLKKTEHGADISFHEKGIFKIGKKCL